MCTIYMCIYIYEQINKYVTHPRNIRDQIPTPIRLHLCRCEIAVAQNGVILDLYLWS